MNEVRDKLVELFRAIAHENCFGNIQKIANYLIANGVTVQRWVPVTERLPDLKKIEDPDGDDWRESDFVLVVTDEKQVTEALRWKVNEEYGWVTKNDIAISVTHWMPLPDAPKEVAE